MQISRVKRSKKTAIKAYDRMSSVYDRLAEASETRYIYLGVDMLAIHAGETVLEIGSGTGKALMELCNHVGSSGKVYGIDLSRGMLRQAQTRLRSAGRLKRANLLQGDGARLPYKSETFTAVFISFTLELFDTPEIPLVLEDCQRVLQRGGRLGVVAMRKSERPGRIERLYEWIHEKAPAYIDCRPIHAGEMIQIAGFKLETSQTRSMWGLPIEVVVARKA